MADEATDKTVQGGDPSPAGEPTPPAIQDEADGASAAAQDEGEGGAPIPEDAEGDASDGAQEKDPERRWRRRVDRLTARNKDHEEEIAKLRGRLEELEGEREKRELEGLQGLPVMPEALTREEREEARAILPKLDEAAQQADRWFAHADEGVELNGRQYSAAQCREFGRMKEREAARLGARLDALRDKGRGRLAALLKKYRGELLGEPDKAQAPKAPATPPPAPPKPKTAAPRPPERAPGGGSAPSGKDGAGNPPPPHLSQDALRRLWAD